jgi:hypothetical protein
LKVYAHHLTSVILTLIRIKEADGRAKDRAAIAELRVLLDELEEAALRRFILRARF